MAVRQVVSGPALSPRRTALHDSRGQWASGTNTGQRSFDLRPKDALLPCFVDPHGPSVASRAEDDDKTSASEHLQTKELFRPRCVKTHVVALPLRLGLADISTRTSRKPRNPV